LIIELFSGLVLKVTNPTPYLGGPITRMNLLKEKIFFAQLVIISTVLSKLRRLISTVKIL
jgi:hypothetical protein